DGHRPGRRLHDTDARPPHERQGDLVLRRDAVRLGDRVRLERDAGRRRGVDRPPAHRSDQPVGARHDRRPGADQHGEGLTMVATKERPAASGSLSLGRLDWATWPKYEEAVLGFREYW